MEMLLIIALSLCMTMLAVLSLNAYYEWRARRKEREFMDSYLDMLESDLGKLEGGIKEMDNKDYRDFLERQADFYRKEINRVKGELK